MRSLFGPAPRHRDGHWITVSDLMAALMMVFLFVAIATIRPMQGERDAIREIAVSWRKAEMELFEALEREFAGDLQDWNAELERETMVFRFKAPEVLFAPARSGLRPRFRASLDAFFPRYMAVLWRFRDTIGEVRIEGHTSSDWGRADATEAYFRNMALSQARTRSVLEYCLSIPEAGPHLAWARHHITATGLSSSRLLRRNGTEDRDASRRVEFRVRTNADARMSRILERIE
jgi:outer membrane protein OmpA-like peptidoglycan-associated protein